MKVEKLFRAKLDKAPRNISPRSAEYNIELGCLIGHLEKPLFRAIGKVCGFPAIFKGINAEEQGLRMKEFWDVFDDPIAVGLDASRFD